MLRSYLCASILLNTDYILNRFDAVKETKSDLTICYLYQLLYSKYHHDNHVSHDWCHTQQVKIKLVTWKTMMFHLYFEHFQMSEMHFQMISGNTSSFSGGACPQTCLEGRKKFFSLLHASKNFLAINRIRLLKSLWISDLPLWKNVYPDQQKNWNPVSSSVSKGQLIFYLSSRQSWNWVKNLWMLYPWEELKLFFPVTLSCTFRHFVKSSCNN